MLIDVDFTYSSLASKPLAGKQVVILDIFRATSTITTALSRGAHQVLPALSPEEACSLREHYPEALVAGEYEGRKIAGFALGNSPLEYQERLIRGRTIILVTTNGTKAVRAAGQAEQVFIGSFLNAAATVQVLNRRGTDLLLACAGTQGTYSLEDACCAGYFIHLLGSRDLSLTDSAQGALLLYRQCAGSLYKYLIQSRNGKALRDKSRHQEIEYCLTRNRFSLVPVFNPLTGAIYKESPLYSEPLAMVEA